MKIRLSSNVCLILTAIVVGTFSAHDAYARCKSVASCYKEAEKITVDTVKTAGGDISAEGKRFGGSISTEAKIIGGQLADVMKGLIDIGECAVGVTLGAPALAASFEGYRSILNGQGKGVKLPMCLGDFVKREYGLNPNKLHLRVGVSDTPGDNIAITLGNRVYFPTLIDPTHDDDDMFLLLHELEHVVQWEKKGVAGFLAEYACSSAMHSDKFNPKDTHDAIGTEKAADAKASRLLNRALAACNDDDKLELLPAPTSSSGSGHTGHDYLKVDRTFE